MVDNKFAKQFSNKVLGTEFKTQTAKEECEARGWVWNEALNSCDNPNIEQIQREKAAQAQREKEALTPVPKPKLDESGRPTDIPFGVPLTREQSERLRQAAGGQKFLKENDTATEQIAINEKAAQRQQALNGLGLTAEQIAAVEATPLAEANIDWEQALTAGAANVIPSAVGGAATGAVAGGIAGAGVGSTITAPAGAIIGGAAGLVSGFASGIRSNIKDQQKGEIGAANKVYTSAVKGMRDAAMIATDPKRLDFAIESYEFWEAEAYLARKQLKAEVSGNFNKWSDDGREDLKKFDLLLDGEFATKEAYRQRILKAAGAGISTEDIYTMMAEDLA